MHEPWKAQLRTLGEFLRVQRKLANLSLREVADMANVSNAYLSQVERGLHAPSVRVLKAVATALNISADTLLAQAGLLENVVGHGDEQQRAAGLVEAAILTDPRLTNSQKEALVGVYRSYVSAASADEDHMEAGGASPQT
jgi:transcriptional regulator with XRE-family HTH domain